MKLTGDVANVTNLWVSKTIKTALISLCEKEVRLILQSLGDVPPNSVK